MKPAQATIERLYQAALQRDAANRSGYLDDACAGDPELRQAVEALLAPVPDSFLKSGCVEEMLHSDLVGQTIGACRVMSLLGSGGMGEVYRARDSKLGREVAIKVLPPLFAADRERLARFDREAHMLAALNHPHIGAIYGVEEAEGCRALVLELVEGETLTEKLAQGSGLKAHGLPLHDALGIALQIADALEAAHEKGIVHRDLKPANIKVTPEGVVKVLDFGLAKIATGDASTPDLTHSFTVTVGGTREGAILGTPGYMSPEQARGKPIDKRTDIWAFGCVLYELLTGRQAFAGETISDTIAAILEREPDWTVVPESTPTAVRHLLAQCLEKDPTRRLRDIGQARIELDDALAAAASPRRWSARALAWSGGATLAAIVALGIGVAIFGRSQREQSLPLLAIDATAGKTRVAVLPFENLTRQPDDDWLAGAFSDALTFGFQPLSDLILVPRESVADLYRERSLREADRIDAQVVRGLSQALGVRYYVHGSYQKVGGQLRVNAQLVDAESGTIKAQESVTRDIANLLQLEDDLARQMASGFETSGVPRAVSGDTSSLDAYRAVVEARGLYAAGDFARALTALTQAVKVDPRYGLAWAQLAKTYARLAAPAVFAGGDIADYRREALQAANRAVELVPSLYESHVALALAYRAASQVEPWRAAAQKAIGLNPRMAEAYALLGDSYSETPAWGCGRERDGQRSAAYYREALRIDPTFQVFYRNFSTNLLWAGHADEALQLTDEGLSRHPSSRPIRRGRAAILISLGRLDDAETMVREAIAGSTPSVEEQIDLAAIELKRGHGEAATMAFQDALARDPSEATYRLVAARYYFDSKRIDSAIDALEQAFTIERACAQWLTRTNVPFFSPLRTDPRVRAVLAKYGAHE